MGRSWLFSACFSDSLCKWLFPFGSRPCCWFPGATALFRVELVLLMRCRPSRVLHVTPWSLVFHSGWRQRESCPRHRRLEDCPSAPSRWSSHTHIPASAWPRTPWGPQHTRAALFLGCPAPPPLAALASPASWRTLVSSGSRWASPCGTDLPCVLPAQAHCALLSGVSGPKSCPTCYLTSCFQPEVKSGPCCSTLTRVRALVGSSVLNFFCAHFSDT